MKGDFSRLTFRSAKHYSSVRMQQGRVQLDADWNEQIDIQNHLLRTQATDVIGPSGVPAGSQGGFKIAVDESGCLTLSAGRCYVDGILCENEEKLILTSEDLKLTSLKLTNGFNLVYLDVWERHITAVEDPLLREVALGGPDTTTRTQIVWRVLCWDEPAKWEDSIEKNRQENRGKLKAQVASQGVSNPCSGIASGGYRGLENQLYRVEMHSDKTSFKWSRDNGIVLSRVTKIEKLVEKLVLTVEDPGKDTALGFAPGQWVEVNTEEKILNNEPGVLGQLEKVEGNILVINSWGSAPPTKADYIRRWDHQSNIDDGGVALKDKDWIDLENGVQVWFDDGKENYLSGDYWLIPARAVDNSVDWPVDDGENPKAEPPHGIYHHYCRLAVIEKTDKGYKVSDCRPLLPPLTEPCLYYVGGDGQEAKREDWLPQPLQVRVANGQWPREGATVRFKVTPGNGVLSTERYTNNLTKRLDIKTGPDGIARCYWHPDKDNYLQQVTATLIDPIQDNNSYAGVVDFTARLSIADQVTYDGSYFPDQQHPELKVDTVEAALDQLRGNTVLHYVGGDGQEVKPGDGLPQPLQVRMANGQWPREGAKVKFEVVSGKGILQLQGTKLDTNSTSQLEITTGPDGIAQCYWFPDSVSKIQQVKAALHFDPIQDKNIYTGVVYFTARLSIAEEVSYNPHKASPKQVKTVQEAIDELHDIKVNRFGEDKMTGPLFIEKTLQVTGGTNVNALDIQKGNLQVRSGTLSIKSSGDTIALSASTTNNGTGNATGLKIESYGSGTGRKQGITCSAYGTGEKLAGQFSASSEVGSSDPTKALHAAATSNGTGNATGLTIVSSGSGMGWKEGIICSAYGAGQKRAGQFFASSGTSSSSDWTNALYAMATSEGTDTATGLFVNSAGPGSGWKQGINCLVKDAGHKSAGYFRAESQTAGSSDLTYALSAYATSEGTGEVYGLWSEVEGKGTGKKYGIYSMVSGVGEKYAGYFVGDVHVSGTLTKTSNAFLIDHPLDPENKTLRHNAVESSEDLCLYCGKAKLDSKGQAPVKMPNYFAALTKEENAIVSLTPIGNKPFLTSYEWNRDFTAFTIYGEAGREVSYMVLANRDDPAIRQLRRPVEEEKGNGHFEKGQYLNPEAYGKAPGTAFAVKGVGPAGTLPEEAEAPVTPATFASMGEERKRMEETIAKLHEEHRQRMEALRQEDEQHRKQQEETLTAMRQQQERSAE